MTEQRLKPPGPRSTQASSLGTDDIAATLRLLRETALRKRAQRGKLPGALKDGGTWPVDANERDRQPRRVCSLLTTTRGRAAVTAGPVAQEVVAPNAK